MRGSAWSHLPGQFSTNNLSWKSLRRRQGLLTSCPAGERRDAYHWKPLDAQVTAFRRRPLDAGPYTFCWVDELTVKVREDGRVVNVHALIATGVNRDGHRVEPGLYALGSPGPGAAVLVTADYTLSFDALRSALAEIDAYILVLDTQGINVWCAAGKGTFGTDELVKRAQERGGES